MAKPPPIAPERVEDWIFDLDNTLYPASCNLFQQVDRRIREFIQGFLRLNEEQAQGLQRRYFRAHGSSMRGMMLHHGMDPGAFLDYVHDIDLSPVPPAPGLDAALARLPGRKTVYTNGSTAHAGRVLERLGIARHFSAVFDIVQADYVPKPQLESYDRLVARYAIDPARAVLVEDLAQNLGPAAALGMTTVWVAQDSHNLSARPDDDAVHHVIEDLAAWLSELTALLDNPDSAAGR